MKKETFLKKLKKKLELLDSAEIEDILFEYSGYIDEKMESGSSEEEAAASFGDVDDLAQELLKAYKVNPNYQEKDVIGSFSQKVLQFMDQVSDIFTQKSMKELIQIVVELLLVLFFIALCHLPVEMLEGLGKDVFYILSYPLNKIFYTIWRFVLELSYIILAILAFAKCIKKRYLESVEEPHEVKKNKTVLKNECPLKKKSDKKSQQVEVKRNFNFMESIVRIFVIFCKFIAICVLFGISIYLIVMGIVLGFCGYLIIKGVTYFGFYLVMIALFVLGALFFKLLFHFVLDRSIHATKMLIWFFSSFLVLGFGCALATFEVADTTFLNQTPEDLKMEILTEDLPYGNNLIFVGNVSDYVVDNSLDHIVVQYQYYPIGTKMGVHIQKSENKVYLGWEYDEIHITTELLNRMIQDLKEKKIYNYYIEPQIIIKANEKQLNVIKKNRQSYYHTLDHYSSCEFTRTYYVESIKKSKDSEYAYLTLSTNESEDIYTVKLKSSLVSSVEVGFFYEFTFKTYQSYIDTDIEEVFHDAEVKEITKTNKVGVNQIQDHSCTVFY